LEAKAQYHVMAGEMAAGRNLPELAAQQFLQALEYAPNTRIAAKATAYALQAGKPELALTAAQLWQQTDTSSVEARSVVALMAFRLKKDKLCQNTLQALFKDLPAGAEEGFALAENVFADEGKRADAALKQVRQLISSYPQAPEGPLVLARLALRFKQNAVAETAVREALKLEPTSHPANLILIRLLVEKNQISEAEALLEGLVKAAEGKAGLGLRLGYAQLLLENEKLSDGKAQLEKLLKLDAQFTPAHLGLGLLALDERELDTAEKRFQVVYGKDKDTGAYYLGRIQELRKQPEAAITFYQEVESGPQAVEAVIRRALLLGRNQRLTEARELFDALREQAPRLRGRVDVAEGELLTEIGQYEAAQKVFEAAFAVPANEGVTDLLYSQALLFERMSRIDLAEGNLRKILTALPDNTRALNALGYILISHSKPQDKKRYDEAEKLIDQALLQSPNAPEILDSRGWLLFKQGKLAEAQVQLQKAFDKDPDPEIASHLIEVIHSQDRERAKPLWQAQSQQHPDSETLKALGLRLKLN
jgi:tetratricopeptide (TPR) repeat protein